MIVPYTTEAITEVTDIDDLPERMLSVVHAGLPAFVMHVSLTKLPVILRSFSAAANQARLRPAAPEMALGAEDNSMVAFNNGRRDLGFHADGRGGYNHNKQTRVSVHWTTEGKVKVRLFEVIGTEDLDPDKRFSLRPEAAELYSKGMVDDTILAPICHEAMLREGSILAVRIEGECFQAHDFISTVVPRRSSVQVYEHIS